MLGSKVNVTAWPQGNTLTFGLIHISFALDLILEIKIQICMHLDETTYLEVSDSKLKVKVTSFNQRSHIDKFKYCPLDSFGTPDQNVKIFKYFTLLCTLMR